MSVTYSNAAKAARMTATRDFVAAGTLELLSAADAVLAVFTLTAGGGTVTDDAWTVALAASTVSGEAAAGTGTVATKAQVKDSGGTAQITGLTVGTSGTDVVLNNANIAEAQDVSLSSVVFTHAA